MKLIDLTGQRFGKLLVLERVKNRGKEPYWLCQCDCGNKKEIAGCSLRGGLTTSCGCIQKEMYKLGTAHKTHGLSKTRLDNIYYGIKARCLNPNDPAYKDYGGRGITICQEWLNDRTKFFEWALNNGFKENLTIDRINNNGNYEPSNCRWVDMKIQSRNRRSNHLINFDGEIKTITDWAETLKMPYSRLKSRLKRGWSLNKAFTASKMKNQYA